MIRAVIQPDKIVGKVFDIVEADRRYSSSEPAVEIRKQE